MARRGTDQDERRRGELAFFRWEFLRRNTAYKEDRLEVYSLYEKALRRAGYPKPGYGDKLPERIRLAIGQTHFVWRVAFLQDPSKSVPLELMRGKSRRREQNPFWDAHAFSILSETEVVDPKTGCGDTVRFKNLSVDFRWQSDWLPFAVNLEARPETLQRELMALLRKVRAERRTWEDEAPVRLEASSFSDYLKAWDLKQHGLPDESIAIVLGLAEKRADITHSNLLRVRRAIRQAKALIASGFRRIS